MKNQEIKNRLELLHAVLKYCADNTKIFNVGERIIINQERSSLIKLLTTVENEHPKEIPLAFKVNKEIEKKIADIQSKGILNVQMPYIFEESEY